MTRRARLLRVGFATLAVAATLGYGIPRALWWYNFERLVTWDSWLVRLPGGGAIRYTDRSPRMRYFGPADTEKMLTWTRQDGRSQSYPISIMGGGSYRELEVRLREDGRAVWLVSLDWKRVVASLDLQTGRFTGDGGAVYDAEGVQSMEETGTPAWATLTGGRLLAHKRF